MGAEIKGENGTLEIYTGEGSRSGDFFLDAFSLPDFEQNMQSLCIRMPLVGGGVNPKTHLAISNLLREPEGQPRKRSKAERPCGEVVLLGDDFFGQGDFSYLRMVRDADGVSAEVKTVGMLTTSSGLIRFGKDAGLNALYDAARLDSAKMRGRIQHGLQEKSGYLYEGINENAWKEADRYYEALKHHYASTQTVMPEDAHQQCYGRLREEGLFLLRAGVKLPVETQERWMLEFGALPEVQAALALGAKKTRGGVV